MVGGRLVGLPRLVVAATGEPLLALAAGLGAALHVPLADLVLDEGDAAHPGDGETALAHEQHAPLPRRLGCGREVGGLGRAVVRTREGQPGHEVRAVDRLPAERAIGDCEVGTAVAGGEVGDPPLPARDGDQDGRHAATLPRQAPRPVLVADAWERSQREDRLDGHPEEGGDPEREVEAGAVLAALEVADGLVVHAEGVRQLRRETPCSARSSMIRLWTVSLT